MPKVYEYNGIEFKIFPNDHKPAHVHIVKKGEYIIKMFLENLYYEIDWAENCVSSKTIILLQKILKNNKLLFINKWKKYADNGK